MNANVQMVAGLTISAVSLLIGLQFGMETKNSVVACKMGMANCVPTGLDPETTAIIQGASAAGIDGETARKLLSETVQARAAAVVAVKQFQDCEARWAEEGR